jgi:hypothetical protein
MRVQFKTEGGFAYLPGLSKPVTIDADRLSPEEAGKLERLVEAAGFFDLPTTSDQPRSGADVRSYTISISSSGRDHAVSIVEPIENPQLQALVDFLGEKARDLRAGSRSRGSSSSTSGGD